MKNFKFLLSFALMAFFGFNQSVHAQTIAPSTGTPGINVVPAGWTNGIGSSNDISNSSLYADFLPWICSPALPATTPTGASTWITWTDEEFQSTVITGLTDGSDYTLTFYTLSSDIDASFDQHWNSFQILIDGVSTTISKTADCVWETQTVTFTASGTTATLQLGGGNDVYVSPASGNVNFSVGADGVQLAAVACNAGTEGPQF